MASGAPNSSKSAGKNTVPGLASFTLSATDRVIVSAGICQVFNNFPDKNMKMSGFLQIS